MSFTEEWHQYNVFQENCYTCIYFTTIWFCLVFFFNPQSERLRTILFYMCTYYQMTKFSAPVFKIVYNVYTSVFHQDLDDLLTYRH